MRIIAALQGNLNEVMKAEFEAATEGIVQGVKEATEDLRSMLRVQVRSAKLGKWLENSWRSKFYLNHRTDAAGVVYCKRFSPIIRAFDTGATIKPKNKLLLAIPIPAIRGMGRYRKGRITPTNFPVNRLGKLVFIPGRTRNAVLLAVKKYKRKPSKKTLAFVLLKQAKLPKRLDIARTEQRITALLPRIIQKNFREN